MNTDEFSLANELLKIENLLLDKGEVNRLAAQIIVCLLQGGRILSDSTEVAESLLDEALPFQKISLNNINQLYLTLSTDLIINQTKYPKINYNLVKAQILDLNQDTLKALQIAQAHYAHLLKNDLSQWPYQNDQKALFLDRDGVLIEHVDYIHQVEDVRLNKSAIHLIQAARKLKQKVFVVTNQSGLGRQLITSLQYDEVTQKMIELFAEQGCFFDHIFYAPFFEDTKKINYLLNKNWRKPSTGMFLECASSYQINLKASTMVGDRSSDLEAALDCGIKNLILLKSNVFLKEETSFEKYMTARAHNYQVFKPVDSLVETIDFLI